MMDNYKCVDVTEKAHSIAGPIVSDKTKTTSDKFGTITPRYPVGNAFHPNNKVRVRTKNVIEYGNIGELDISGLEQVVNLGQTHGIVAALQRVPTFLEEQSSQPDASPPTSKNDDKHNNHSSSSSSGKVVSLQLLMHYINNMIDKKGLNQAFTPHQFNGNLARPRLFEIAGAINRLRKEGNMVQ